jgi:EAL domain-containing protein (putative c-di-GMP-specific phosphodiesterase class I)
MSDAGDIETFPPPAGTDPDTDDIDNAIDAMLRSVRKHLNMDIAFIGEFVGGRRVFRYIDAGGRPLPIAPGDSAPLEETYCQHIVDGSIPELLPDTSRSEVARSLAVTDRAHMRAHLGAPIRLSDGCIYGTFCCVRHTPDETLNLRDLQILRVFADAAAQQIERGLEARRARDVVRTRIADAIEGERFEILYQPIFDIRDHRIVALEALSRFSGPPVRGPDLWFAEAETAGLGEALEIATARRAVAVLPNLPLGVALNVNVSPTALIAGRFQAELGGAVLDRIAIEITEHSVVDDYEALMAALGPLRPRVRLAVDDVGAGYATLRHVVKMHPDTIKLDISLTRGIEDSPGQRALAAALVGFASQTGAQVVAEGVETQAELATLAELGIRLVQGYLLARPAPFEEICRRFARPCAAAPRRTAPAFLS